jgi:hypothetical protein
MAGHPLKTSWYVAANELKERWPDLTESDLLYIHGDEAKLVKVVQKRRHISEEEARADVEFFIRHLNTTQNVA